MRIPERDTAKNNLPLRVQLKYAFRDVLDQQLDMSIAGGAEVRETVDYLFPHWNADYVSKPHRAIWGEFKKYRDFFKPSFYETYEEVGKKKKKKKVYKRLPPPILEAVDSESNARRKLPTDSQYFRMHFIVRNKLGFMTNSNTTQGLLETLRKGRVDVERFVSDLKTREEFKDIDLIWGSTNANMAHFAIKHMGFKLVLPEGDVRSLSEVLKDAKKNHGVVMIVADKKDLINADLSKLDNLVFRAEEVNRRRHFRTRS